jgi:hypothetical protein
MRRVAKWLAEYWENIGRCVPEFNAVFDPVARPALYQRVYPYGGDGTRVWDVHGTGYTADELDVWFQDAKLRIEQAAALIERAYRYLRLLELLPDGERQVMWTYGELDLKVWIRDVAKNAAPLMAAASSANISLPGDGEIPSMKWVRAQFEPFLIDKTKRDEFARIVTRRYRRCPSLRVWFGTYSPELLSYLLITYGILMRRFGLGFAHTRTHVSPLRFRLNLDASAVTSWHAVPGWIVLREKRLDDFARIERTIHEACHWLWFGSTRPFHKSSFVNQGLPRDVRKNECYDDTGDSTCYDLGGAFALHRVNRSTGSPYSLQNIDNFVTWTMSLYYNNSQFGIASVDDLASGTLAAWPYPRGVSDVWVPPPLLARISWSPREPVSGTPGSFDSECGAYSILAAIVGSTGGIDDAKADFC